MNYQVSLLARLTLTTCFSMGVTHAQQVATGTVTPIAPTTLSAMAAGGTTSTDTLPVGALPTGSANLNAVSSSGSQTATAQLTVSNYFVFTRMTARAEVGAGPSPAFASVTPIDIVVDYSFTAPAYPEFVLKTYAAAVGPGGTAVVQLDVDVGNDGTIDHSISPTQCATTLCDSSQPDVVLPITIPTNSTQIRFTGSLFAGPDDFAILDIDLFYGTAPGPCTFTSATPPCGGTAIFTAVHRVDHAIVMRRNTGLNGTTPILVLGFSELDAQLPFPSPNGSLCSLHPFPDIVVPMAPANPPVLTGLAFDTIIPPFTATTPLPFTFWAQSITLGSGSTPEPLVSNAIRVDCQ